MMEDMYFRSRSLIGSEALERLKASRVAVFGIGGVGGYAAEALARSGVGSIDIVDKDVVSESNINRQIIATQETLGKVKVEVMAERLKAINPELKIRTHHCFFLPNMEEMQDEDREGMQTFRTDFGEYDYVIDAVDTVTAKIELVLRAVGSGTPIISSMGTGNKLYPERLEVSDIFSTSICPLAKVMRKELRKRGISSLKVVYSREEPKKALQEGGDGSSVPSSMIFVPASAGLLLAREVVMELAEVSAKQVSQK